MSSHCPICGKRVADIHTCTPNPVIKELRAAVAERDAEIERIKRGYCETVNGLRAENGRLHEALFDVLDAVGAVAKSYELEGYGVSAERAAEICAIATSPKIGAQS